MSPRRGGWPASDLKPLLGLCNPAPAIRPDQASIDKLLAAVTSQPVPLPGTGLRQPLLRRLGLGERLGDPHLQGVILIDALNNADEAKRVIDDGMRKVGLDPADDPLGHRHPCARRPLRRPRLPRAAL